MTHICELTIDAPLHNIFLAAADITRWPEFLPHYRYNRFLVHTPTGGVVKTACTRGGFGTNWVAEFHIDTQQHQLHFHHIKSTLNATVGMKVVWEFSETPAGSVLVTIAHHLPEGLPLFSTATGWLLNKGLIHDIAMKTLAGLKHKVETHLQITQPRQLTLAQ
jgi:hypothetical protein